MLVPREHIQFRRDREDRFVAFSPLLPGCEATADNEADAVRALQRAAHQHLRHLRDAGEPFPEPFATSQRRHRTLVAAVIIGLAIAAGLAVLLIRPATRADAYRNLGRRATQVDVRALLGPPDHQVRPSEHEGYTLSERADVETIWIYDSIKGVGRAELHFNQRGMLVAKPTPRPHDPADVSPVAPTAPR